MLLGKGYLAVQLLNFFFELLDPLDFFIHIQLFY